jgi:urease gamma subunit
MTRWRAKRRYEANRRFGERADEALVAISILKAKRDGIDLEQSEDDLRAKLESGRHLLEQIRDALDEDPNADPYELAIAEQIQENAITARSRLVGDFDELIEVMEAAEETLTYQQGLDDVREKLKEISETANRTSRDSINRMRGTLADGTR